MIKQEAEEKHAYLNRESMEDKEIPALLRNRFVDSEDGYQVYLKSDETHCDEKREYGSSNGREVIKKQRENDIEIHFDRDRPTAGHDGIEGVRMPSVEKEDSECKVWPAYAVWRAASFKPNAVRPVRSEPIKAIAHQNRGAMRKNRRR